MKSLAARLYLKKSSLLFVIILKVMFELRLHDFTLMPFILDLTGLFFMYIQDHQLTFE